MKPKSWRTYYGYKRPTLRFRRDSFDQSRFLAAQRVAYAKWLLSGEETPHTANQNLPGAWGGGRTALGGYLQPVCIRPLEELL
jgi:hypothetical protein